MEHVRGTGRAFALDDFGAGATGFRHFRDFRFDMVKIDGAFIRDVHTTRDAQVLVECLAARGAAFRDGRRRRAGRDRGRRRLAGRPGIDCLQGYLYGRPAARPTLPPADADGPPPGGWPAELSSSLTSFASCACIAASCVFSSSISTSLRGAFGGGAPFRPCR